MATSIVYSDKAPEPIGPYSQGILSGNTLYASGQIALDRGTNALITDTIENETNQVMANLHEVLKAAGMDFSNVVKCSIFLTDMGNFPRVNEIYGAYFKSNPPARETVEVKGLPKGAHVEISCIAVK